LQIKGEKVVVSGMSKRPTAIWDREGVAAAKSTVLIIPKDTSGAYIAALINSEVMNDLYNILFGSLSLSGGYLRFGPPQIRALPVPDATPEQQLEIAILVEQILALYEQGNDLVSKVANEQITALEREIDERVAQLYGLPRPESES
jgi:adenine-specific DNA-methyltransferase